MCALIVFSPEAAAGPGPSFGMLPETVGMGRVPSAAAHTIIVTILYLPSLLVLCLTVAQAHPDKTTRSRGDLAA